MLKILFSEGDPPVGTAHQDDAKAPLSTKGHRCFPKGGDSAKGERRWLNKKKLKDIGSTARIILRCKQ